MVQIFFWVLFLTEGSTFYVFFNKLIGQILKREFLFNMLMCDDHESFNQSKL